MNAACDSGASTARHAGSGRDGGAHDARPPSPGEQVVVFLQPGEYFAGDHSFMVRTTLGSCISVALWSPMRRMGAMSHSLLAQRGVAANRASSHDPFGMAELDGRYGDEALLLMLDELGRHGVGASQLQAKIFGGGDMFPTHRQAGVSAVGRRNGEAARAMLQDHGIAVISESLFGDGHRQIAFDIASGDVWERRIQPAATSPALRPAPQEST